MKQIKIPELRPEENILWVNTRGIGSGVAEILREQGVPVNEFRLGEVPDEVNP